MKSGTEVSIEVAKRLWKTHSVFAYDESLQVEWQLNVDDESCTCKIYQAIKDGAIIFVDNIKR